MKMNKSILAAVLALGISGLGHAGTVYMSGSTAMRSIIYTTLTTPGLVFSGTPAYTAYEGTATPAGNSANYMAFTGNLVGSGGSTTIQCHWTGSEGGIADVASGQNNTFIGGTPDGIDHGTNEPGSTISASVMLAMADNAQSFSRTKTPAVQGTNVAIITFEWIRNNGLMTATNVSDSQLRQLLKTAGVPLAVFSGTTNSIDTNTFVYITGRDYTSGTRVNAYADCGYGILSTANQIELDGNGNMVDLSGNGSQIYSGDYGFSSGGLLVSSLAGSTSASTDPINGGSVPGFSVIAYAGVSDATKAVSKGYATVCSFNGVPFSADAVKNGTYSFWGSEYLYKANSGLNTDATTLYNLLSAAIPQKTDNNTAINLKAMYCTRSGPTSDPAHN